MSNRTIPGSTLLIPESVVWLPYVGVVLLVLAWLGYDFFLFHSKNKAKYARMRDFMSVQISTPQHHRISMISGIGLSFKHGIPILGDAWNTSPSSSDHSNYSPLPAPAQNHSPPPYADAHKSELRVRRTLESVVGILGGNKDSAGRVVTAVEGELNPVFEDSSQHSYGFSFHPSETDTSQLSKTTAQPQAGVEHTHGDPQNKEGPDPHRVLATVHHEQSESNSHRPASVCDASTQTPEVPSSLLTELSLLLASEFSGGACPHPGEMTFSGGSPRLVRPNPKPKPTSSAKTRSGGGELDKVDLPKVEQVDPVIVIDFSPSPRPRTPRDDRAADTSSNPATPTQVPARQYRGAGSSGGGGGGGGELIDVPSLRLDMLPHTPRSAREHHHHSRRTEGIELVPQFPGASQSQVHAADLFQTPGQSQRAHQPAFVRSAINSASSPSLTLHPPQMSHDVPIANPSSTSTEETAHSAWVTAAAATTKKYDVSTRKYHSQRLDRTTEPTSRTFEGSASARQSPARTSSSSQSPRARPSGAKTDRAGSASPQVQRNRDRQRTSSAKLSSGSSKQPLERVNSERIPSQMFHQDDEGYFCSVLSQSRANAGQLSSGQDDSGSKKGILFFSRLSGAGRKSSGGQGSGDQRYSPMGPGQSRTSSGFRSGGFES